MHEKWTFLSSNSCNVIDKNITSYESNKSVRRRSIRDQERLEERIKKRERKMQELYAKNKQ